jgi:5-methylcytosine-specific restriction endonuclease McrA
MMTTACGQSQLRGLSDRQLLRHLEALAQEERATTLEILHHLIEVERRRAYCALGFGSLFDYCTRHLGYSASAAGRRIAAARCMRTCPELSALLAANEVNLSTVALVAPVLDPRTKDDLLHKIRGKSQREVEALVAQYGSPVALRDRVKPVCVAVPDGPAVISHENRTSLSDYSRSGSAETKDASDVLSPVTPSPPRVEPKVLIQFVASEGFMKKYDQVRALLSNRLDKPTFESVFDTVLDEFIERHDPERRKVRREQQQKKAMKSERTPEAPVAQQRPTVTRDSAYQSTRQTRTKPTRHIPAWVRDEVYARDKGRCAFVGRNGTRCGSTHGLHIDHVVPFAQGGGNTTGNLRLLCARHNRLEAERVYGKGFMESYHRRE